MKRFLISICALAALCAPAAVLAGEGHDHSDADESHTHDGAMNEEQMKMWMAAMTPGEAHKHIQSHLEGEWEYVMRSYEDPQNPTESKGTSVKTMVFDRFLMEKTKGMAMGQPFEGMGLLAYSNVDQRYEGVWFDTMGTALGMAKGGKFNGKTIDMVADFTDPATRLASEAKWITKVISKDKHVFEWHMMHDGTSMKAMEIEYVRAGVSQN